MYYIYGKFLGFAALPGTATTTGNASASSSPSSPKNPY